MHVKNDIPKSWLFYALLCCMALFSACNTTKYIPKGDSLFVGATVKIADKNGTSRERSALKTELANSVRPKPNRKFLGMRLRLAAWYAAGGDSGAKKKGPKKWLYNFGEPPVLASTFSPSHNVAVLESILASRGFFRGKVTVDTVTKNKKTKATFTSTTGPRYHIRNIDFSHDSMAIAQDILEENKNSLLKSGDPYDLNVIKAERDRLDRALKDKGYYFFKADYIILEADTTVGDHQVDLLARLKRRDVPEEAKKAYIINKVVVYPNYRLNGTRSDTSSKNAIYYDDYYIISRKRDFKPSIFYDIMQFSPGDTFSRTTQENAIARFINLGVFKFIKNRFEVADTTVPALNAYYYLTPFFKKSLRGEVSGNTQSDSRVGSTLSLSWRNRNAFHGAELLTVKAYGGFEVQSGGGSYHRPNTYDVGLVTSLSFPRFIVPFFHITYPSVYVPHTLIKAGYVVETQGEPLRVHSFKASFGYDWREDVHKEHQLYPINFYYVRTDTLVDTFHFTYDYSNIIFNGVILGPSYEYTYNSQPRLGFRNNFYFDGQFDYSGPLKGLGRKPEYNQEPLKIFGTSFAQFVRFRTDFRHYFNINKRQMLASRLLLGLGIPFGYSYQLPNIKQFFSGGSSSLRGFQSRLVGPGTFNEQYLYGTNKYLQMLGDIKMEFSTELRFTIYSFIKGAAFFDAGNIWTYVDNPKFPGGKFTKDFYKELAADVGLGIRLDLSFFILRLDWGIPVRKPWLPDGQRWVFNQIDPGDPHWRSQNLIFNFAIGYPF